MKQTIRFSTFETNSSSTHSLIVIPDEDYMLWKNGDLYYLEYDWGELNESLIKENNNSRYFTKHFLLNSKILLSQENFPHKEENEDDDIYNDRFEEFLRDNDFVNKYTFSGEMLEQDENEYITKSGDKIHLICKYGYNG